MLTQHLALQPLPPLPTLRQVVRRLRAAAPLLRVCPALQVNHGRSLLPGMVQVWARGLTSPLLLLLQQQLAAGLQVPLEGYARLLWMRCHV